MKTIKRIAMIVGFVLALAFALVIDADNPIFADCVKVVDCE